MIENAYYNTAAQVVALYNHRKLMGVALDESEYSLYRQSMEYVETCHRLMNAALVKSEPDQTDAED